MWYEGEKESTKGKINMCATFEYLPALDDFIVPLLSINNFHNYRILHFSDTKEIDALRLQSLAAPFSDHDAIFILVGLFLMSAVVGLLLLEVKSLNVVTAG